MSGDHNMNQKKPMIKIDGVEINQTTPYIDYDAWIASPLTKALKDKLEAAVDAEREACAKVAEEEIARVKPLYSVTAENIVKQIRARGEKK
jgi:hypothetical protein